MVGSRELNIERAVKGCQLDGGLCVLGGGKPRAEYRKGCQLDGGLCVLGSIEILIYI